MATIGHAASHDDSSPRVRPFGLRALGTRLPGHLSDSTEDEQHLRPGSVSREKERRIKKRGILLGVAGLFLALGALSYFRAVGLTDARWSTLAALTAVTVLVQTGLWTIPHLGWDRHLAWDDDYVLLPLVTAAFLLLSYAAVVPEARFLLLIGWFAALLFGLRFLDFREVMGLGVLVTGLYAIAMAFHLGASTPPEVALRVEAGHAAVLLAIHVFAAGIFERVRREHAENEELKHRLAEESVTDPLTGLRNRRYLERFLETETARADRYGASFSLAMVDLDHFKIYNDTHGHPAGDRVLQSVGEILLSEVREADLVARYGGEEFTIVMPDSGEEEARAVCERIRRRVEERSFPGEAVLPRGLTVSVGVASFPGHADTADGLVEGADRALYEAKERGRNAVAVVSGRGEGSG